MCYLCCERTLNLHIAIGAMNYFGGDDNVSFVLVHMNNLRGQSFLVEAVFDTVDNFSIMVC